MRCSTALTTATDKRKDKQTPVVDKTTPPPLSPFNPYQNHDPSVKNEIVTDNDQSDGRETSRPLTIIKDASINSNPSVIESLVIESSSSSTVTQHDHDDGGPLPEILPSYPIHDGDRDDDVVIFCF